MDMQAVETWLCSELETTGARLRSWRERALVDEVVTHGDDDVIDAAQQTTVVETRSADAARLADRVRRLARALGRLRDGRYGICEECDAVIAPARLLAVPDAARCMTCQQAWERSGVRPGQGDLRRPYRVSARARRGRQAPGHGRTLRGARRHCERQGERTG